MMRKYIMIVVCALFVMSAAHVFAEDVFTTANGTKYHKQDCRLLRNKEKAVKIDKKDAVAKGYIPCKRCFKEDLLGMEQQSKTGVEKE